MKVVALLTLFFCASHAQTDAPLTDCISIGFPAGAPFTGGEHPVCGELGGNQCCSPDYLTAAETRAEMAFKEALRDQLDDSDELYALINTNVTQYLMGSFIQRLATNFPLADQLDPSAINQFLNDLTGSLGSNLIITDSDNFNPEEFIDSIVGELSSLAGQRLGGGDQSRASCVENVIMESVNTVVEMELANAIQTIRQSASAISSIQAFLAMQRVNIVNRFTPIRGCVERLVQRSFCGRCSRRIPPLCRGSCNALVRGCLSPIYSAFQRDFRQLWNISRAIVRNLQTTVGRLFTEQGQIITNQLSTFQRLASECSIDIPFPTFNPPFTIPDLPTSIPTFPPIGKRQSDDDDSSDDDDDDERGFFNFLGERLEDFDGIFEYDDDGPDFCEPMSNEEDFCEEGRSSDRSCQIEDICTSECRCWDGNQMRETDAPGFTRNGVNEQGDNPAVDGLEEELVAQANQLGTDTPANAFLSSDEFRAVVPEGIEIPDAEPFTGGAVKVVVSLIVMVIAMLVSLVL